MAEEKKANEKGQVNMWQEILREAMTNKEIEDANIFIFGDKLTGKKSLIKIINKELISKGEENRKLLSLDEVASSYGLIDYTYLNVKNLVEADSESIGKMGVWIINDQINKDTFQNLIRNDYLVKAICLIVVDLSRPWTIKESLKKWTEFAYDTFSNLILKFPLKKQEELRNQVVESIKLYEEPQFDEEGNFKKEPLTEEQKQIKLELPLKDGVLKSNCGVPMVFVVNKSDVVSQTGEKKHFEENSDFILKHIRQIALMYGAGIVYVSGKANTNLSVLYDYICHQLFHFDLTHKPNLIDKDAYFIPSGYDSLSALKNSDTQGFLEVLYDERIPPEKTKNVIKEEEIVCEDTNVFLGKLKTEKGKSLLPHKKTGDLPTHNRGNSSTEGANKFQKFLERPSAVGEQKISAAPKRESEVKEPIIGRDFHKDLEKDPKYTKTREAMMKKLGLLKNKKDAKK